MVYQHQYDGYYTMSWHDREENALKRWFDNFKIDRHASFADEYECLIVQEVPATAKHIKKRQICRIEDEGRGTSREVIMDHTAPTAPMLTFAAKLRWQPPPPKTPAQIRQEAEYAQMYARGYEPRMRRVPVRSPLLLYQSFDMQAMSATATMEYREEIEWVPRRRYSAPVQKPKEPTHRRNV